MGMERVVTFPGSKVPPWEAVREWLARRGFPVQMRMIDGQLAFPDEKPPDDWREIRVGTPQGMITLRRDGDRILVITWGNADAAMIQAWNALAWACAAAGAGEVQMPSAPVPAADFAGQVDLPPVLQGKEGS
jgi:hypothetical protein